MHSAASFAEHRALVARVLASTYGLGGELHPLVGDADHNLRLDSPTGTFLVKLVARDRTAAGITPQIGVLDHLARQAPRLPVQRVVRTADGRDFANAPTAHGTRLLWVTTWLQGTLLADVRPATPAMRRELGRSLAELDRALLTFDVRRITGESKWDLRHAGWIDEHLHTIEPAALRTMVAATHRRFVHEVAPRLERVRRGVIHGDGNDHNVLVARDAAGTPRITGILDFGDLCHSALVGEVAIAATYAAMAVDDSLAAIDEVVSGYDSLLALTDDELELVVPLILTRLAVSITNAAVQQRLRPDDPYVTVSQRGARALLQQLHHRCPRVAAERLRIACGRSPCTGAAVVPAFLSAHRLDHATVLPGIDLVAAPLLDLSFDSTLAGDDPTRFDADIAALRIGTAMRGARAAIGRYLEPRPIYSGPAFGDDAPTARRRTVHLGIDLFAPAGTAVTAPIQGTVHHVEHCPDVLDYGGLVVLRHVLPDGTAFGTLYGHLDPAVATSLQPGQSIAAGERFASLGTTATNGGWPPHLHLQVLACDPSLLPRVPPGVADPDDLAAHAALYPDPAPLLGLPAAHAGHRRADPDALHARRAVHFASNLRTSYRTPAALVRGWRHFLFDQDGRRHLDAYNNVPHVGHCHPRVVRAIAEQSALLSTNTRYLHDGMQRYAERLAALLPRELSVFFFTASGSEANELALRLARTRTGAKDLCVMDHGYHGHTTGAMAVSPYKFRQPGASRQPDWVHVTVQPDVYRGAHRGPDAGRHYAAEVQQTIDELRADGGRLCGYLCECLPSVGGQLELPSNFLADVYRSVRASGGICIADDVQTALWRTGDHAFGFQRHDVVPDVLVLGKPLGNGFPLGAVVTTRAVAESFAKGPEFFSTFGGSTVAMAAGLAVLDVLADEDLAANATCIGDRLLAGLRELQDHHESIGDVRGRGLFLGVELVTDRDARTPATTAARHVKDRLRERRVLIGTDGPFDNVLKIRPPMTFDGAAADALLEALDSVLGEDGARRQA